MAEPPVRWKCEALGLVQRVGYRDRVRRAAKELGLVGWVENDLEDEDRVLFEVQGEQPLVERLVRMVSGPAGLGEARSVTRLEVLLPDPTCKSFLIRRDSDAQREMSERMDEAALYLGASLEVGKENLAVSKETLGVVKENLVVSKETLGVVKENLAVSKETLGVVKETLGVVKETLAVSKETLGVVKENLVVSKETLAVSKETLGVVKENLVVSKETLAVSKETLAKTREVGQAVESVSRSVERGNAAIELLHRDMAQDFDDAGPPTGVPGERSRSSRRSWLHRRRPRSRRP